MKKRDELESCEIRERLFSFCLSRQRIFLYGAGDFAAVYTNILKQKGIAVTAFIVTKGRKSTRYMGLPVYELDEALPLLSAEDGIVLALRHLFHTEIRMVLPKDIAVFGISDDYFGLIQREYLQKMLRNGFQETMKKAGIFEKLATNSGLRREIIRIFSEMCNANEDDPDIILSIQETYLNEKRQVFSIPIHDTAIVMQGPICRDNDFTLRTALFYRSIYPDVPIVISTWQGELYGKFHCLCNEKNIIVLENKLPDERGFRNYYYQMSSSFSGIEYMKRNTQVNYVLKCRTDQRINKKDFLSYFKNLSSAYAPSDNRLSSRIIIPGMHVFPFYIIDFFAFGAIEDLRKYYIPRRSENGDEYLEAHRSRFAIFQSIFDKAWHYAKNHEGYTDLEQVCTTDKWAVNLGKAVLKFINPEIWISRSFYDSYIEKIRPDQLMKQYLNFLKHYLVAADTAGLQIYWHKYKQGRLQCLNGSDFYLEWLYFYMNYSI